MKDYKEMAQSVFDRIEQYEYRKKRTEKMLLRAALGVSGFAGLLVIGIILKGAVFSFPDSSNRYRDMKVVSEDMVNPQDSEMVEAASDESLTAFPEEAEREAIGLKEVSNVLGAGEAASWKKSIDLTKTGKPKLQAVSEAILEEKSKAYLDFSLKLFRESMDEGDNSLISPLSVLYALGMTVNGADRNTLAQMEKAIGMNADEINTFLNTYRKARLSDQTPEFKLANSVWVKNRDDLKVEEEFIQKSVDYYQSPIFQASFDNGTLKEINQWISDKTKGLVKDVLDKIDNDAVLYLINAMCFEANWEKPYRENQVIRNVPFTSYSGERRKVRMMESKEKLFLSDERATGFMKLYEGGDFAFAAILPNKGVDIKDYMKEMTASGLKRLLEGAEYGSVFASLPSFEYDSSFLLNRPLIKMGMKDAFDGNLADFSRMARLSNGNNLVINRVLHKTHITVDEAGTKAGAATVVEMKEEMAILEEIKEVVLDRPFVYMIVDRRENIPVFIGMVTDIGS